MIAVIRNAVNVTNFQKTFAKSATEKVVIVLVKRGFSALII